MSSIAKETLHPLRPWKNFVSSITKKLCGHEEAMKKLYIFHHQEIPQPWRNFVSITKKLYNNIASNFGKNLQARTTNSHASKQHMQIVRENRRWLIHK